MGRRLKPGMLKHISETDSSLLPVCSYCPPCSAFVLRELISYGRITITSSKPSIGSPSFEADCFLGVI